MLKKNGNNHVPFEMGRKNNSHYYLCTCISAILTQKNAYISTTRSGLAIMIRNNAEEKGCRDGPESRI